MRKLKRAYARFCIKNAGVSHINKHGKNERSFFAEHWRDWLPEKKGAER